MRHIATLKVIGFLIAACCMQLATAAGLGRAVSLPKWGPALHFRAVFVPEM